MQETKIYQVIFQHSVQGMVLYQDEMVILVNQSFADMVGYTIDEFAGRSVADMLRIIYPTDPDGMLTQYRERMDGRLETRTQYETRVRHRNGELRWLSVDASVIEYQGKRAILGTYIDITEQKRAEDVIRGERQLLADILDALPIGVCLTDETGHYHLTNAAYDEIYDYERGEIIGRHYSTIVPPEQLEMAHQHYARLLSGDTGIPQERVRRRRDGTIIHIEAANGLVHRATDEKYVITAVRDVTERKEMEFALRDREEQFRTLVNEAPFAILVVSADGVIRLANREAETLFGYDENALENILVDELVPAVHRNAHRGHVESFLRDAPHGRSLPMAMEIETYGLRQDGSQFPADITLGHIQIRDEKMVMAFIMELSDRLELERQRLALRLHQERNAIVTSFIQNAAHEFRTPLSIIKTGVYLLNKAQNPEQREKHTERISVQIDAIVRLVTQLTLLTRLTHSEAPSGGRVDLQSLLQQLTHMFQEEHHSLTIRLQSQGERIHLMGNLNDLGIAFTEVLDNAVRFSPDGSEIDVTLDVEDDEAVVSVQDHGMGMSPETLSRIFERFFREDTAHSTRGFGLGLPLAERIIELHGGTIQTDSAEGEGTTMIIRLPITSDQ